LADDVGQFWCFRCLLSATGDVVMVQAFANAKNLLFGILVKGCFGDSVAPAHTREWIDVERLESIRDSRLEFSRRSYSSPPSLWKDSEYNLMSWEEAAFFSITCTIMPATDFLRSLFPVAGLKTGGAWKTSTPMNTTGRGSSLGRVTHLNKIVVSENQSAAAVSRNERHVFTIVLRRSFAESDSNETEMMRHGR
jgi:hypothetical protein